MRSEETALAGYDIEAMAHLIRGNIDAVQEAAGRANEIAPEHYIAKSHRALIAASQGDRDAALTLLDTFDDEAERSNHWAAFRVALVWARLDEADRAMEWLERAVTLGNHSWYLFVRHPWLESLQTLPRFQQLLARVRSELDDVHDDAIGMHRLLCDSTYAR